MLDKAVTSQLVKLYQNIYIATGLLKWRSSNCLLSSLHRTQSAIFLCCAFIVFYHCLWHWLCIRLLLFLRTCVGGSGSVFLIRKLEWQNLYTFFMAERLLPQNPWINLDHWISSMVKIRFWVLENQIILPSPLIHSKIFPNFMLNGM